MNRLLILIFTITLFASTAAAQLDTVFTYQGDLQDPGDLANAQFSFVIYRP